MTLDVFTNADGEEVDLYQRPVIIYARLTQGDSLPVLGARVYLDVEVENSNGTVFVLLPSLMLDNGHGEPDMTGDDGESWNV